jgi:hypothetical protein
MESVIGRSKLLKSGSAHAPPHTPPPNRRRRHAAGCSRSRERGSGAGVDGESTSRSTADPRWPNQARRRRCEAVAQGASRDFNPSLPLAVVDRAYERDAAVASSEYGGQFRADLEAFVSRDVVEAAIDPGIYERAPIAGVGYCGFVDPSGGAQDSMTLAIAHKEDKVLMVDAIRERKSPFSPENVCAEFSDLLKRYRIARIEGDRYAGEWPREAFRRHGIECRCAKKTKSELYGTLLPELNSRNVALLDSPRLVAQLVGLERRTSRGGRDIIDHAPGSHDDIANAVAGALVTAISRERFAPMYEIGLPRVGDGRLYRQINDEFPQSPATANWRAQNSSRA